MKKYNIKRFVNAHQSSFAMALEEIQAGYKMSHWMWYIFPQIKGLGYSDIAEYYAIEDLDEAKAYLKEPTLAAHMQEICDALLKNESNDAEKVMGWPDDLKLRSSMTLFAAAEPTNDIYQKVLNKFFEGKSDEKTFALLRGGESI